VRSHPLRPAAVLVLLGRVSPFFITKTRKHEIAKKARFGVIGLSFGLSYFRVFVIIVRGKGSGV
jgi:hypothetical protein